MINMSMDSDMVKVLVINGANMNMLGKREIGFYGTDTLTDLENIISERAAELGIETDFFQSNHEGAIVDAIHAAGGMYKYLIINPAAHTHYSIAIHDALKSANIKAIEVHMSNIHAREEFRKTSITAPACIGQITGFGVKSYLMALEYIRMESLSDNE